MKTILIGERYREKLESSLYKHGILPFWLPENPDLDPRLSAHIDLSVFKHGKTIVIANYLEAHEIVNYLTSRGYDVKISKTSQGVAYPKDVNLCASVIGNKLLHNIKYTDPEILKLGLNELQIKQGYARCTALIVDNNSIITADPGIADATERNGIDVLRISSNGIVLEGFDSGFIGGASYKAEDTIYFTGDIKMHSNANQICEFISKRGLECCSLTKERPFDIGGAVYIE